MVRQINSEGLEHIKRWEGCKLTAYADLANVMTIGYGHTAAAGPPTPKAGMKISMAEAEAILRRDLAKFERRVESLVKVPLTDNQFAALVSFDFNTGALHKSTLLKKLNAGDYDSVPTELAKWVNARGKRVQGLVNRRASEAGLWAKGAFVSSNNVEAAPASDPVVTKENVSWGAGILAMLGTIFSGEGPVQYALAAVIVLAFIVGGFLFVRKRMRPS